ncbi:MAG: type II toxin-antitoxin system HipA family toxin [Chthoniobacter sp.]|nr:type II toxin-antitoxin system HipA family toxin [Chthoniobacter sp.]
MDRALHVYVDLGGQAHLVGRLWARRSDRRESATFEYDKTWLENSQRFALEPALTLDPGPHHTTAGHALFGAIGDSAPDRWGRLLIQREERRRARAENRTPHSLGEADYLLGVGDFARQGALRFSVEEGGEFLRPQKADSIPPLVSLGKLLGAAMRISASKESDHDLQLLLAPGSSLGGARPKASVIDNDGRLAIAKFPQPDDDWPVTIWEAVALELAHQAGIPVSNWRIEHVQSRSVLLLSRFDRDGAARIPFLSAMSMLGAMDNQPHSYLELVDALRQHGSQPEADTAQLWRRIVFNILISNTDDHLRNHGFLYDGKIGWQLSPAYDLNPMPIDIRPRILSLAIDEVDSTASLELAFDVAKQFGVKSEQARKIAHEVGSAVSSWRKVASRLGLTGKQITRMESAFEHDDLRIACRAG